MLLLYIPIGGKNADLCEVLYKLTTYLVQMGIYNRKSYILRIYCFRSTSFYIIKTLKWGQHSIEVHSHKPCRVEIYMFMDPNYP